MEGTHIIKCTLLLHSSKRHTSRHTVCLTLLEQYNRAEKDKREKITVPNLWFILILGSKTLEVPKSITLI